MNFNSISLRKKFLTALVCLNIIACSSDSENSDSIDYENNDSNLELSINIDSKTFGVDEILSFSIESNENLKTICMSVDDWSSSQCTSSLDNTGLGESLVAKLSFSNLGTKTINIKIENYAGEERETKLDVNIEKKNTVTIKQIHFNSFNNIGESWDAEFLDSDENRLADLTLILQKRKYNNSFVGYESNSVNHINWLTSDILENQGDLTWELNENNLLISPENKFSIYLYDFDGPDPNIPGQNLYQEILLGWPYEKEFSFEEYMGNKPNEIIFVNEDIDLEVVFEVEWN